MARGDLYGPSAHAASLDGFLLRVHEVLRPLHDGRSPWWQTASAGFSEGRLPPDLFPPLRVPRSEGGPVGREWPSSQGPLGTVPSVLTEIAKPPEVGVEQRAVRVSSTGSCPAAHKRPNNGPSRARRHASPPRCSATLEGLHKRRCRANAPYSTGAQDKMHNDLWPFTIAPGRLRRGGALGQRDAPEVQGRSPLHGQTGPVRSRANTSTLAKSYPHAA